MASTPTQASASLGPPSAGKSLIFLTPEEATAYRQDLTITRNTLLSHDRFLSSMRARIRSPIPQPYTLPFLRVYVDVKRILGYFEHKAVFDSTAELRFSTVHLIQSWLENLNRLLQALRASVTPQMSNQEVVRK